MGTNLRAIGFLTALAAMLMLTACADRPHHEICARILDAMMPADEQPRIVAAEHGESYLDDLVLRFRLEGDENDHQLACRFAGTGATGHSLRAVELDGVALSTVQLVLLHRWLRQPLPPELLKDEAPQPRWTLKLHAAYLIQQILNGLVIGAVIALVAVGYTLVYGITRHIQFAYGELLTIGALMTGLAYVMLAEAGAASLATVLGLGLPVVIGIAALAGFSIERVAFRLLRHASLQTPLIAAVGLSIFLQEAMRLTQGARTKWMPALVPGRIEFFTTGGFTVSLTYMQIVIVVIAALFSLMQGWILARTGFGRSYRAVADDPRMAALSGVDVNRVVGLAYASGAALAAVAGAAILMRYGQASTLVGVLYGFKALTAAILGGIGSFGGALVGGLLIGLTEALWAGYMGASYRDAAVFGLLVLVLVFKPDGLFGRDERLMPGADGGAPGSALRSRPSAPSRD